MFGPRPTATRSRSASICSPFSRLIVTESALCSTPVNFVPVLKAILRLRNWRSSDFERNSSSLGTRCGRASTIVTSLPKLFHTLANSTPMTPPPSTTTRSGT